eukprot:TRINITY_DN15031_c0_g1_i3.p1 TRINITY_DN15031_c0_g1~~TRINITY_DN15031_c0_g1_i3.p1  ORF type:complete len:283 (+),score=12.99 TRINITY_DN15031_c0_g1_i3:136-984(+)
MDSLPDSKTLLLWAKLKLAKYPEIMSSLHTRRRTALTLLLDKHKHSKSALPSSLERKAPSQLFVKGQTLYKPSITARALPTIRKMLSNTSEIRNEKESKLKGIKLIFANPLYDKKLKKIMLGLTGITSKSKGNMKAAVSIIKSKLNQLKISKSCQRFNDELAAREKINYKLFRKQAIQRAILCKSHNAKVSCSLKKLNKSVLQIQQIKRRLNEQAEYLQSTHRKGNCELFNKGTTRNHFTNTALNFLMRHTSNCRHKVSKKAMIKSNFISFLTKYSVLHDYH